MTTAFHAVGIFTLGLVSGGALVYTVKQRTAQLDAPVPYRGLESLPPKPNDFGKITPTSALQFGLPGPISDVAVRAGYASGYDRRMRNPAWVAEHLTPEKLARKDGNRGKSVFYEDETVPQKYRARLQDYLRSGYDRGHQVPAADCKFSQHAMDETFALTNICPQVGDGFNRD